jgi:hypothetical protein
MSLSVWACKTSKILEGHATLFAREIIVEEVVSDLQTLEPRQKM